VFTRPEDGHVRLLPQAPTTEQEERCSGHDEQNDRAPERAGCAVAGRNGGHDDDDEVAGEDRVVDEPTLTRSR
jgi:hypothetical protein